MECVCILADDDKENDEDEDELLKKIWELLL